jgi:hypothetical protein
MRKSLILRFFQVVRNLKDSFVQEVELKGAALNEKNNLNFTY